MKRVLITGMSRGLGLAVGRSLLERGWSVVGVARRRSSAMESLAAVHPGRFEFHEIDLGAADGVALLVERARVLEGLDALVANAALGMEGLLTLTRESAMRECVELNLVSPMLLAREVLKGMLAAGRGGSLVFVSSVAARTGLAGLSVYSATKGGLVAFARSLAREYGERGIRVNSVLPGFLETEMTAGLEAGRRQAVIRRSALKRLGRAEDVVGAVLYLLSEDATHVTGTEIVVDGGLTA